MILKYKFFTFVAIMNLGSLLHARHFDGIDLRAEKHNFAKQWEKHFKENHNFQGHVVDWEPIFTKKQAELAQAVRDVLKRELSTKKDSIDRLSQELVLGLDDAKIAKVIHQCQKLAESKAYEKYANKDKTNSSRKLDCEICAEQSGVYTQEVCKTCSEIIGLMKNWENALFGENNGRRSDRELEGDKRKS